MTVRQEAYQLIDMLPDESVRLLVELMGMMQKESEADKDNKRKERAFAFFESMRRPSTDTDYLSELRDHREEKYGDDRPH